MTSLIVALAIVGFLMAVAGGMRIRRYAQSATEVSFAVAYSLGTVGALLLGTSVGLVRDYDISSGEFATEEILEENRTYRVRFCDPIQFVERALMVVDQEDGEPRALHTAIYGRECLPAGTMFRSDGLVELPDTPAVNKTYLRVDVLNPELYYWSPPDGAVPR